MTTNNGYEASKDKLKLANNKTKDEAIKRFNARNLVCKECGTPIPYEKRKEKPKFCNRSCSAIFNNKNRTTKRKKRLPYKHTKKRKTIKPLWGTITKGELKEKCGNYQSWRTRIRVHSARIIDFYKVEYKCVHCGYTLHNEICHKRDVKDFDDTATLDEINDIDNLVYLCPTHHWEFDNGHLEL